MLTVLVQRFVFKKWNQQVSCGLHFPHYSNAIMGTIASKFTGFSIACPRLCSGADQRKLKARHWPLWGEMASYAENVFIWWHLRDMYAIRKWWQRLAGNNDVQTVCIILGTYHTFISPSLCRSLLSWGTSCFPWAIFRLPSAWRWWSLKHATCIGARAGTLEVRTEHGVHGYDAVHDNNIELLRQPESVDEFHKYGRSWWLVAN